MGGKRLRKKHGQNWNQCPLCGNQLPNNLSHCVVGQTGRAVCLTCLRVSQDIIDISDIGDTPSQKSDAIITPSEMIQQLDRSIIGQERAKQAVAVALWKQQLRAKGADIPSSGILLYGPTGCGKTALLREAAKISGLPFIVFDASTLSEAGYRGNSAEDIPTVLIDKCGIEEARHGIIFLDEIDKLAAPQGNEYRGAYSRGTQHSLLKLIEGSDMLINGESFSTSGIQFFFGGAFTGLRREMETEATRHTIGFNQIAGQKKVKKTLLPDDFIRHGMEPELMGRINRCIPLFDLTSDELKHILLDSELSALRKYQIFFQRRGLSLHISESDVDSLVQSSLALGLGARGLNALVEEWIEPKLFQLANGEHHERQLIP